MRSGLAIRSVGRIAIKGVKMNEFETWLEANNEHLKTYSLDEIYDLAIACGLSRIEAAEWYTKRKFVGGAA